MKIVGKNKGRENHVYKDTVMEDSMGLTGHTQKVGRSGRGRKQTYEMSLNV